MKPKTRFCQAKFAKNKIFFYYLCSLNSEEKDKWVQKKFYTSRRRLLLTYLIQQLRQTVDTYHKLYKRKVRKSEHSCQNLGISTKDATNYMKLSVFRV